MASITFTPPLISSPLAHYEWDCSHAAIVHNGAISKKGGRIPARPWTDAALDDTDLEQVYSYHYAQTNDVSKAWELTALGLGIRFKDKIESVSWEWNGITRRRNGDIVGSPRDIVDTGELLNSQSLELLS